MNPEIFGWVGTNLFIACYMPQIWRTYKRHKVGDISLGMWLIQWSAYTSCLVYSFSIGSLPLIYGYLAGWMMTAWYLYLYWRFK